MTERDDEAPAALRAHFVRHNLTAIALSAFSVAAAIVFWLLLYLAADWAVIFFLNVRDGVDAIAPLHFPLVFSAGALVLCLAATTLRWLQPHERVADREPFWKALLDTVLIAPRLTFAAWGNAAACRFLTKSEMTLAWRLLQKIAAERKINVQSVAVEIPDARAAERIVIALQIADLVYLKKTDEGFFLTMRGDKARELAAVRVRINVGKQPEQKQLGG